MAYKIFVHPDGRIEAIDHPALERFSQERATTSSMKRVSHIEPCTWWLRQVFKLLRRVFGEKGAVAAFTRRWSCRWRANLQLSNGPITDRDEAGVPFGTDRQKALDFEVRWLNEHRLRNATVL